MQKVNWKRLLAVLMAFMLFVAEVPAMAVQATGKEEVETEPTVSDGNVTQGTGVALLQNPEDTLYYYGLTYPSPNGLQISLTLGNGQTEEIAIWDEAWNNHNILFLERTATGAEVEYDEFGNIPVGNYRWEIYAPEVDAGFEIPFTVLAPETSPELALNASETVELQQKSAVYQFVPEETGDYELSMLNDNFCFVRVVDGNGREICSRGLDSMSIYLSMEAEETYYYIFSKEDMSSGDDFEIMLSKVASVEEAELIQAPLRTQFMAGLEMVDIYGLTLSVKLEGEEAEEVEVYSDLWWDFGFSDRIQTSDGEDVFFNDSNELAVGDYQWAISLYGQVILTVPFEVVDPQDIAWEIEPSESISAELTEDEASVVFCYTPEVTACYGLWLLSENCYDLSAYGENNSLRMGWIFDSSYPKVFAMEAGKTYYFTVNANADTEFGEFEFMFYALPLITSAEITQMPQDTQFLYGLQWPDLWGLKFQCFIGEDSVEVNSWDNTWTAYGMSQDVKTASGDYPEWDDNGMWPVGQYVWEVEIPGIEERLVIPFEILDPDTEITKTLTLDTDVTEVSGNGNENYYAGASEWIKISVEEEGTYVLTGTELFRIECYNENGECLQGNTGESFVIGFAQAGTYYAQVWSTGKVDLSMSKLANMAELSAEYVTGDGTYYYGFVRYGIPGEDISVTFALEGEDSQTVYLCDEEAYNAGIQTYVVWADDPETYADWDEDGNLPEGEYLLRMTDAMGILVEELPFTVVDNYEMPVLELDDTLSEVQTEHGAKMFFKLELEDAATYVLKSSADFFDLVVLNEDGELEYLEECEECLITSEGAQEYYMQLTVRTGNGEDEISVSLEKWIEAPVISNISGCGGQAKITWEKVAKATGYKVYRKTGNGDYECIKTITGGKKLTYTDTKVEVGTKYSYVVTAMRDEIESPFGDAESVKIAKNHSFNSKVTKKATSSKNGTITNTCKNCGEVTKTTIYAAKTIKLSKDSYDYDGKAKKPTITVKDSKGKTVNKKNYTVSYKNNKNAGTATVTITFKNEYSGKVTKTFTILPKGTSISKVTADSKGFTVTWKKQKTQTSGYEIQYSLNKNFKSAKTITVNKNTTVSQKVKGLKAKKKYYVRVRTLKTQKVNGKKQNIYSAWSSVKTVTTKK